MMEIQNENLMFIFYSVPGADSNECDLMKISLSTQNCMFVDCHVKQLMNNYCHIDSPLIHFIDIIISLLMIK